MANNYTNSSLGTQNVMFLNKALDILPQNNIISSIRSHMFHVARELPCNNLDQIIRYRRCETCGFEVKKLTHVFNLEPPKKVPRALRRLKLKENFNTKYQLLSRKKFNNYKEMQQILALKCDMCNIIVKQKIRKPYLEKLRQKEQPASVTIIPSNQKAKTKKKKDPFSGLNKSLVNSVKRFLKTNNAVDTPEKLKTPLEIINLVTPDNSLIHISDSLKETPEVGAPINCSTPKNVSITNISDMLSPVYLSNQKSQKRKSTKNISENSTETKKAKLTPQNKFSKTVVQINNTSKVINALDTPKSKVKTSKPTSSKKKKNKNTVLVSDKNEKEKKRKKLKNLSNLLQKQIENIKNTTSSLQDFLNSIQ